MSLAELGINTLVLNFLRNLTGKNLFSDANIYLTRFAQGNFYFKQYAQRARSLMTQAERLQVANEQQFISNQARLLQSQNDSYQLLEEFKNDSVRIDLLNTSSWLEPNISICYSCDDVTPEEFWNGTKRAFSIVPHAIGDLIGSGLSGLGNLVGKGLSAILTPLLPTIVVIITIIFFLCLVRYVMKSRKHKARIQRGFNAYLGAKLKQNPADEKPKREFSGDQIIKL